MNRQRRTSEKRQKSQKRAKNSQIQGPWLGNTRVHPLYTPGYTPYTPAAHPTYGERWPLPAPEPVRTAMRCFQDSSGQPRNTVRHGFHRSTSGRSMSGHPVAWSPKQSCNQGTLVDGARKGPRGGNATPDSLDGLF